MFVNFLSISLIPKEAGWLEEAWLGTGGGTGRRPRTPRLCMEGAWLIPPPAPPASIWVRAVLVLREGEWGVEPTTDSLPSYKRAAHPNSFFLK